MTLVLYYTVLVVGVFSFWLGLRMEYTVKQDEVGYTYKFSNRILEYYEILQA